MLMRDRLSTSHKLECLRAVRQSPKAPSNRSSKGETDFTAFRRDTLADEFQVINLTDEGVHALVERHSSLERIHLSYCEQVSVNAIKFLLNRLLRLTHLSLTGVTSFKTPELQQFCRPAPPVCPLPHPLFVELTSHRSLTRINKPHSASILVTA